MPQAQTTRKERWIELKDKKVILIVNLNIMINAFWNIKTLSEYT